MPGFNVPDPVNNMKVCLQELVRENFQEFHQASDNTKKKEIVENIRKKVYGDSTSSSHSNETVKVRQALRDKN